MEELLENLDDNRRRITLQLSLFSAVFDVFVLFRIGKSRLPVELPTCSSFFSSFSVVYLNAICYELISVRKTPPDESLLEPSLPRTHEKEKENSICPRNHLAGESSFFAISHNHKTGSKSFIFCFLLSGHTKIARAETSLHCQGKSVESVDDSYLCHGSACAVRRFYDFVSAIGLDSRL